MSPVILLLPSLKVSTQLFHLPTIFFHFPTVFFHRAIMVSSERLLVKMMGSFLRLTFGLFNDIPVFSLVGVKLEESYAPEHCPLCRASMPVNQQFGRGKDYVASLSNP